MNKTPQTPEAKEETPEAKKSYHVPELRDYGTVRDLTLTGPISLGPEDNPQGAPYITGPA